jgi:hypothetical protein
MVGLVPIEMRSDRFTPAEYDPDTGIWFKRDDLFSVGSAGGAKARTVAQLAIGAKGLVGACMRSSVQAGVIAAVARDNGIPARLHVPAGPDTPELQAALAFGAEIVPHRPGYSSLLQSRAKADVAKLGFTLIPYFLRCQEAVDNTARQVLNLPAGGIRRIVCAVGSGVTMAGIINGIRTHADIRPDLARLPVAGVYVGTYPAPLLDMYSPGWRDGAVLLKAASEYTQRLGGVRAGSILLDSVYEAKCKPYLIAGDCFWIAGIRPNEQDDYR